MNDYTQTTSSNMQALQRLIAPIQNLEDSAKREKFNAQSKQKIEKATDSAKTRCKTCFKEVSPKRLCTGHGGGADADSDTDKNEQDDDIKTMPPKKLFIKDFDSFNHNSEITHQIPDPGEIVKEIAINDENAQSMGFDAAIIDQLIKENKLSVELDEENYTLSIKLLCKPSELSKTEATELKQFYEAILKTLQDIKVEHKQADIILDLARDNNNDLTELNISIYPPALFQSFIGRLANTLVPSPSFDRASTKDETEESSSNHRENETISSIHCSPFQMTPTPYNTR